MYGEKMYATAVAKGVHVARPTRKKSRIVSVYGAKGIFSTIDGIRRCVFCREWCIVGVFPTMWLRR